jgi:NAD(P)-dependent dehydrogenase (short-subunit alcohol dehydrogenase family)
METADHVARVTGDGSGQGEAAERRLASHGAQVAVLDFDDARKTAATPITATALLEGCYFKTDVRVAPASTATVKALGSAKRIAANCIGRIGNLPMLPQKDGLLRRVYLSRSADKLRRKFRAKHDLAKPMNMPVWHGTS